MQRKEEKQINIREACFRDAPILSELAFLSKSFWGYDKEYLEKARKMIMITENQIKKDIVYVLESEEKILGFYHFQEMNEEGQSELVWLFIDPESIGTGYGKKLWNHLMAKVRGMEIDMFVIKSDPNAEGFYLRQGATRIGQKRSVADENHVLPVLEYWLNDD
ncbi:GNAT family N-acetyltransferase [Paenibacillus sp. YYML68]|uniref:GNAT family N-acetyltransferase n=1 Tax=Paenibacillus sp. YYML68 TaxID=2909250 RepID=UPI00249025FD|nr:GNAT family N-acetyltransferase [Paenibacillus sp. YYML68]